MISGQNCKPSWLTSRPQRRTTVPARSGSCLQAAKCQVTRTQGCAEHSNKALEANTARVQVLVCICQIWICRQAYNLLFI